MKPSLNTVWTRLKKLEGQEFETIKGKTFTYKISGSLFAPSRTKYNIGKSDFAKALKLVPFSGPGEINNLVRGPVYIRAVLHDQRIRGNDW